MYNIKECSTRWCSTIIGLRFARCVKQDGFYTPINKYECVLKFARCVKQDGFYTYGKMWRYDVKFARCVKQDGFYTNLAVLHSKRSLLGVLNKMGSILCLLLV